MVLDVHREERYHSSKFKPTRPAGGWDLQVRGRYLSYSQVCRSCFSSNRPFGEILDAGRTVWGKGNPLFVFILPVTVLLLRELVVFSLRPFALLLDTVKWPNAEEGRKETDNSDMPESNTLTPVLPGRLPGPDR